MNSIRSLVAIAAASAVVSVAAVAQETAPRRGSEYERQQNVPAAVPGTHETRKAQRAVQRASLAQQNRAGTLPKAGDDWGTDKNRPQKVDGTHASRAAERKEKRAEVKQLVKAGELPVTNEAEVSAVKRAP